MDSLACCFTPVVGQVGAPKHQAVTVSCFGRWPSGGAPQAPQAPGAAVRPLPAELWGRLGLFLTPQECVRLCRSTKHILLPSQLQGLWRSFCYTQGYAWSVEDGFPAGDELLTVLPPGQQQLQGPLVGRPRAVRGSSGSPGSCCGYEVDWQRLFRLNALSRDAGLPALDAGPNPWTVSMQHRQGGKHVYAVVRFLGDELRLPAKDDSKDDSHVSGDKQWLCEHGWRPPSVLYDALNQVLVGSASERHVPVRFRELVSGRPGFPIRRARFCAGVSPASVVAEWPIGRSSNGHWCWPLSPHSQEGLLEPGASEEDSVRYMGPHPWGREKGWLVELFVEVGRDSISPGPPLAAASRWVHAGRHKPAEELTLADFCQELAELMPSVGFWPPRPCFPASIHDPMVMMEAVEPGILLSEDLRWTQGERIRLREAKIRPRTGWEMTNVVDGYCSVILFERERGYAGRDAGLAAVGSRRSVKQVEEDLPLDKQVLHSKQLVHCSKGVRQFEFHPIRKNTMLIGRKDGVVAVVDHERDEQTHALEVDSHPILGLAWLQNSPQWAVVGASQSGNCSVLRYDEDRFDSMEHTRLQPFHNLSSLSVRCTGDFFMTSGFCVDVGLYDIVVGRRLSTFHGMHGNYINILRFAHRTPHIFATASFDHTCKVWDLRQPIRAHQPARRFDTDTLNVMCSFSPDDSQILCSGVDGALQQYSLDGKHGSHEGSRFPLPALGSATNYRRSLYLADGETVVTAGTNESVVRLYQSRAPHFHHGFIDLAGQLPSGRTPLTGAPWSQRHGADTERVPFVDRRAPLRHRPDRHRPPPRQTQSQQDASHAAQQQRQQQQRAIVHTDEYVQSLRCHPTDPQLFGAILAAADPKASDPYVCKVHLGVDRETIEGG